MIRRSIRVRGGYHDRAGHCCMCRSHNGQRKNEPHRKSIAQTSKSACQLHVRRFSVNSGRVKDQTPPANVARYRRALRRFIPHLIALQAPETSPQFRPGTLGGLAGRAVQALLGSMLHNYSVFSKLILHRIFNFIRANRINGNNNEWCVDPICEIAVTFTGIRARNCFKYLAPFRSSPFSIFQK